MKSRSKSSDTNVHCRRTCYRKAVRRVTREVRYNRITLCNVFAARLRLEILTDISVRILYSKGLSNPSSKLGTLFVWHLN